MYKFYSEIQIVEGYSSSLLYDLGRVSVTRISNEYLENFSSCRRYLIRNSEQSLQNFLIEKDFVFKSDEFDREFIREIDLTYHEPYKIKRLLLKTNDFLCKELLDVIDWSVCPLIIIYINKEITLIQKSIIEELEQKFYLKKILFVVDEFDAESKLYVESKTTKQISVHFTGDSDYMFGDDNFLKPKTMSTKDLNLDLNLFIESNSYDLYYNKLIILDEKTFSKEPKLPFILSIDYKKKFLDLIQTRMMSNEYLSYSKKKKTDTSVCKDCEFRNMCIDERVPTKRKNGSWYHTVECNYNPFICKWKGEDGYKTLAECGVISNEKEYTIDHDKIAKINQELWGEEE